MDTLDFIPQDVPRWGLLPPGCSNLLDVINAKTAKGLDTHLRASEQFSAARKEAQAMSEHIKANPELMEVLRQLSEALKKEVLQEEVSQVPFELITPNLDPLYSAGTMEIGASMTVRELAGRMGCKWYQIIGALIDMKIFVPNGDHALTFEEAAKVAVKFGFEVTNVE